MRNMALNLAAIAWAVLVLAAGPTGTAYGQESPIYGSQLMTEQERQEHQARMRAATSEEERAQIRAEHHARMQERAKEMGVTLPEAPPMGGMGQGMGRGQGMGMGQGMGRGQGMGADQGGMMGQGGGAGRRGN